MCAWIMPPVAGLIEPAPAPVIWVDGVGAIAMSDDAVTTYYYAIKESLFGGTAEKHIDLIVKRSKRGFVETVALAAAASPQLFGLMIPAQQFHPPNGFTPRLV